MPRKAFDVVVPALPDVAEFHGVTLSAVKRWRRLGHPGRTDRGYSLSASCEWHLDRIRRGVDRRRPDDVAVRWRLAKAEREELKLERERSELVRRADVESTWQRYMTQAAPVITGIADRLLAALPAPLRERVRSVVQTKVDEVLAILGRVPGEWRDDA